MQNKILLIFAFILAAANLHGQSGLGVIAGSVVEAETGTPLPGARITVAGTTIEGATNRSGAFTLRNVPEGTQQLTFRYLGFNPLTLEVVVVAGEVTPITARIAPEVFELEAFEVHGTFEGQARALNQQRTNRNISNVVSADAIGRFPDANIAESLQRLPGIAIERDQGEGRYINVRGAPRQFTSISVDGISLPSPDSGSRAIDLDTIPTDIVNQIEVFKALRPDLSADSIAGAVNIVTQSAFDQAGRVVRGSIASSYNNLGGTNDFRAAATYSDVFADRTVGFTLSASYGRTNRELDNIENSWDFDDDLGIWFVEDTVFKDYETRRTRTSVSGALEFMPTLGTNYFIRGTFAKFEDWESRYRMEIDYSDGTMQPGATSQRAEFINPTLIRQYRNRVVVNELLTLSAGGRNKLDFMDIDYAISFSRAEQYYPSRQELLYRQTRIPFVSYDFSRSALFPEISLFQTNEHLNDSAWAFREYTNRSNDAKEDEWSGQFNGSIPFDLANNPGNFRFGMKVRSKDKQHDEERWRDRTAAARPAQPFSFFMRDDISDNFQYNLGRRFDVGRVLDYFDAVAPIAASRGNPTNILNDYRVEEDIYAVYAMATLDVDQWDFLAGVRLEQTRFRGESFRWNDNTGVATPERANNRYTNLFPSVHAIYNFNQDFILRSSVTTGIARPEFETLAPFIDEDPVSRTVSMGNPDLKPTRAVNYDLMLEYYIRPLGIFSAGVFYKDVSDFIFTATSNPTDGMFSGYRVSRPENASSGEIYGFEIAYQQPLTFLPSPFDGFGVMFNYTRTGSNITLPTGRKVRMPGQSQHNSNFSVYYEKFGAKVQVAFSHRSNYIDSIDGRGDGFDTYWGGREQVDIIASYDVTRNFQVFTELQNVTNSRGKRFIGDSSRVYELEEFGWWVNFGLRLNF